MPPKRKNAPHASGDSHVWILTMEEYCHGLRGSEATQTKIIGVYNSKDAAVASAAGKNVESYGWGNILEVASQYDEDDFQDYRDNPPDDGVLLQLFGRYGEGDYVRVLIKRYPILGDDEGEKKQKMESNGSKDSSVVDLCNSS